MQAATRSTHSATPFTIAFAHADEASVGVLAESERRTYRRLPCDGRRRDWLAGRLAAKRAIAERYHVPVGCIELTARRGRSPHCLLPNDCAGSGAASPSLSIAHCDGVAVAACGCDARVGVDIERVGQIAPAHYQYFVGHRETKAQRMDPTLVWILKEAAWKALGLRPTTPLTSLQLDIDDDARLRGVWVGGTWTAARASLLAVPGLAQLVAAVIAVSPEAA